VLVEAPPADRLESETTRIPAWANSASAEPPLIKAGFAHMWFVTLHPFDDGDGRIARSRLPRKMCSPSAY